MRLWYGKEGNNEPQNLRLMYWVMLIIVNIQSMMPLPRGSMAHDMFWKTQWREQMGHHC